MKTSGMRWPHGPIRLRVDTPTRKAIAGTTTPPSSASAKSGSAVLPPTNAVAAVYGQTGLWWIPRRNRAMAPMPQHGAQGPSSIPGRNNEAIQFRFVARSGPRHCGESHSRWRSDLLEGSTAVPGERPALCGPGRWRACTLFGRSLVYRLDSGTWTYRARLSELRSGSGGFARNG